MEQEDGRPSNRIPQSVDGGRTEDGHRGQGFLQRGSQLKGGLAPKADAGNTQTVRPDVFFVFSLYAAEGRDESADVPVALLEVWPDPEEIIQITPDMPIPDTLAVRPGPMLRHLPGEITADFTQAVQIEEKAAAFPVTAPGLEMDWIGH
jgi:hypothetical protein